MLKKLIVSVIIFITIVLTYVLFNTFTFTSKQLSVSPAPKVSVSDLVVDHFSQAIKIQTISGEDPEVIDSAEFRKFSKLMISSFPLIDSLLDKKTFNEFSFLYEWPGKNKELKPVLLMGHLDVVPVSPNEIDNWQQPPFSGKVIDGQIWGRGTIDDKISVFGILEAVEMLLSEGYQPERTIFLAFGHDEENLGKYGAEAIAKYLKQQKIRFEYVLDEGYSIVEDMIPGMTIPVALIGIAEKGFTSLKLSVEVEGGHSSMPKTETAIDVLGNAIYNLKQNKFPARLSGPMNEFADYLGPEMPFVNKMAFANRSLFKSLIVSSYEKSASGNALLRTTIAPTIFRAGLKENVIPQYAEAIVNFRIIPGETGNSVKERVEQVISDERVTVEFYGNGSNPSEVSATNAIGFNQINKTIKEVYPEVLVAPNLVIALTDSRYYKDVADQIYRFAPIRLNPDNISTFHGVNERIGVEQYKNAIRFYRQLIINSGLNSEE